MRNAEQFDEALAEVDQLQAAAARAAGNIETDERAEAHAVGEGEVGQVEDDTFAVRDELADAGVENLAGARDEPAVAAHSGDVAGLFDIKG